MDFLDPLYQRRHTIRLYIGYGLVAIAIFLAVTMLLLVAYGYQLSKDGQVIQKGLLFASSRPTNATVYLDGVAANNPTNTRLNIPEGSYELQLQRDGYRNWQHRINISGGTIRRYDYPLLIPESLTTKTLQTLGATAPGIATITPDSRWLLVQPNAVSPSFVMWDLKDTTKAPTTVALSASSYTAGGKQTWQIVSWASDKTHALLRHGYGAQGASEYILLNRTAPAESINLSTQLKIAPTKLAFIDGKFDRYYVYNATAQTLSTARLNEPVQAYLKNVLDFDTYKADTVLYIAATQDKTTATVDLHLRQGQDDYVVRHLAKAAGYHLAVSEYSGSTYVAVTDTTKQQHLVYVYKNPLAQLKLGRTLVPVALLKIEPTYLAFSTGGRFVVAERGTSFATYDAEYKQTISYQTSQPIDAGQPHAFWMDGAHLQYASNKQLYLFDYDGTNTQIVMPAANGAQVFYDANYRYAFSIAPPTTSKPNYILTSTALRTAADL